MPLGEVALRGGSDRDAAEPLSVELERGNCERPVEPDLLRAHDRLVLLVCDDERLLVGEERMRSLVTEVHAKQPLAVELRHRR